MQRLSHTVPKKARKEFERAEKAADKEELEKSIAHLRKAIEIDPACFEALVNLGARLLRAGQAAEALAAFEKAMRIDESNSPLHANAATALLTLNRPEDAKRAARTAVGLDPLNARARYMLALALLRQNSDVPEALASLERICDEFPYARITLAQTLAAQLASLTR